MAENGEDNLNNIEENEGVVLGHFRLLLTRHAPRLSRTLERLGFL